MPTFLPFLGIKFGAVVRALSFHQFGPGFKTQCQHHMWVEFVVSSLRCSERFFFGFSGFPSPLKPTFPYSNSTSNQVDEGPQSGCATSKSLFVYFIYLVSYLCTHSFIHLLDPSLCTFSLYCLSFFSHHQAQKKERSTNVQKRTQASFSKLTT